MFSQLQPSAMKPLTIEQLYRQPDGVLLHFEPIDPTDDQIQGTCFLDTSDPDLPSVTRRNDLDDAPVATWVGCFEQLADGHTIKYPKLRRLSCALTMDAVLDRTKTVTRRLRRPMGLEVGSLALLVDKQRVKNALQLAPVQITSISHEILEEITADEVKLEGFPSWKPERFIAMFQKAMKCERDREICRLEWRYL